MTMISAAVTQRDPSPPARAPRPFSVETAGRTHVGRERARNEDQFVIVELQRSLAVTSSTVSGTGGACRSEQQGTLLIVADGMGGHGGGDVASGIAVSSVVDYLCGALPWFDTRPSAERASLPGVRGSLSDAVRYSDEEVRRAAGRGEGRQGMGTTLTLGYLSGSRLYLAHVGDSRAYLLRQGQLSLLTRDHTLGAEINAERPGTIPPDGRWHHLLTRAVGAASQNHNAEPDVSRHELRAGDVLMLCSDGLSGLVDDETIRTVLAGNKSCDAMAQTLVHAANAAGGRDNITTVVARCAAG